jgi:ComB9 competence protein
MSAPVAALGQDQVQIPKMPIPPSVIDQAHDQQDGYYGHLVRPRSAGQVQETWDDSPPEAAVYRTALCTDCTYKVRLREWMVSMIELPRGEKIEAVDIGDAKGFQVSKRGEDRLALRPVGHGYDTNLIVYGKSGTVYPFYLRAEGFNSGNTPDFVVRLEGTVGVSEDMAIAGMTDAKTGGAEADGPGAAPKPEGDNKNADAMAQAVKGLTQTNPITPPTDFVADAGFDPDALRGWGDYRLWGSDDSLKPETVFRDDHFTYVRFGEKWKDIELPTAYVVVDGLDELVNTRVAGQTYIIESTRPLITLKSGDTYLCIEYEGGA